MYKTHHAEQMMIPEIDSSASQHQNQLHFILEVLPLLEDLRNNNPREYSRLIDTFRSRWPSQSRHNFEDTLEYILVFLKNSFGMEFHLEENESSYVLESVSCPLVAKALQQGMSSEIDRKTLCYHCSEFHLRKFFRMFGLDSSLQLFPSGCQFEFEKARDDRVNPLFY